MTPTPTVERVEDGGWSYRLFGWWYRWQACKMAAHVLSNRNHADDRSLAPVCWSLAVFFELYMTTGADGTCEEFGPNDPVELKAVGDAALERGGV